MSSPLSLPRRIMQCALLFGLASTVAGADDTRRPNIILIFADDLGYGDLGCYGQQRIQTPALDRLAREGRRFTQFYSASTVCAPARNALMVGRHTGHTLLRGNAKIDLRPEDTTIAEILRGAGYATALIGKWGLGRTGSTGDARTRGFDHAFGYVDQTHAHNFWPSYLVRDGERLPLRNVVPDEGEYGQGSATTRLDYAPDLIIDDTLEFIRNHRDRPFFIYFATTLPHANNEGKPHGMEIQDTGAYADESWPDAEKGFAAMVTRLDTDVGRIVATIDMLDLGENTLIIFTSDNGPHNEGGHDAGFFNSGGPLRGSKRSLYEGGIRVPTIARWTGRIPAGTESDVPAYLPDLHATFVELAGQPAVEPRDGVSLATLLREGSATLERHTPIYWQFHEAGKSTEAVRLGRWKALRSPRGTGPVELYDLETDIGETKDIAAAHPEIVERAKTAMDASHTPSTVWP